MTLEQSLQEAKRIGFNPVGEFLNMDGMPDSFWIKIDSPNEGAIMHFYMAGFGSGDDEVCKLVRELPEGK